jgi:hypothetical protein
MDITQLLVFLPNFSPRLTASAKARNRQGKREEFKMEVNLNLRLRVFLRAIASWQSP